MQADGHEMRPQVSRVDSMRTLPLKFETGERQPHRHGRENAAPRSRSGLCGAELADGAEPVFHVEGPGDLAVADGLDIDRHDPEALAGVRHAEQVASRRSRYFATHDDA